MKTVLSSALSRAMREELVVRNVAHLAELPQWERKPVTPWTAAEARIFLDAAKGDPLYPAFMLLLLYVLRRVKFSACAGVTSTKTTEKSASVSRSSG